MEPISQCWGDTLRATGFLRKALSFWGLTEIGNHDVESMVTQASSLCKGEHSLSIPDLPVLSWPFSLCKTQHCQRPTPDFGLELEEEAKKIRKLGARLHQPSSNSDDFHSFGTCRTWGAVFMNAALLVCTDMSTTAVTARWLDRLQHTHSLWCYTAIKMMFIKTLS